jgi:outer membrane murein-binding lipoprotein Lpp
MSPDSPEARLGRLETAVARLEQRTDDLSTDVRTLTPLIVQVAEIKITMAQVQAEAHSTNEAVGRIVARMDREVEERQRGQEKRREDERRDSKNYRRTLIGIGIAAVLSPIGTLAIALIERHQG